MRVNEKNHVGDTVLIVATKKGYTEIVKLLLAHPQIQAGDKDTQGNTALIYAINKDYTEIMQLLLNHSHADIMKPTKPETTEPGVAESRSPAVATENQPDE
jgi:ankyrin repeat protein